MSKRKRFTDSEKWVKDIWFRKLTMEQKLFWIYINDQCDHAGAWHVDFEQASFYIGSEIDETTMTEVFRDKVHVAKTNGIEIWWIKTFCFMQYKTLIKNETSTPRKSVEDLLKFHGVYDIYCQFMKNNNSEDKRIDHPDIEPESI